MPKPKMEPEKNTMSSTNDADEKDSSKNLEINLKLVKIYKKCRRTIPIKPFDG